MTCIKNGKVIQMKMNRITVISLVLASLVVADANAAWSRAGQFARKVLVSGTGVAAATLSVGYLGGRYYLHQKGMNEEISDKYTNFSEGVHENMQEFMQNRGVKDGTCLFTPAVPLPAATSYKGKNYILMAPNDEKFFGVKQDISERGFSLQNLFSGSPAITTLEDALAVCEHESDHLANADHIKVEIAAALVPSAVLLAAKAARVAGKSRFAAVGAFAVSGIVSVSLKNALSRHFEKRCDLAISSSESATALISLFERVKAADESNRKAVRQFLSQQNVGDTIIDLIMWYSKDSLHPDFDTRISYLKEHAQKLKETEKEGVKTSFRKSVEAIKAAAFNDQYRFYDAQVHDVLAELKKQRQLADDRDRYVVYKKEQEIKDIVSSWNELLEKNRDVFNEDMDQKSKSFLALVDRCQSIAQEIEGEEEEKLANVFEELEKFSQRSKKNKTHDALKDIFGPIVFKK